MKELPLFPLNTVLFPGMTIPLHIFEPRYKLMIGDCIKNKSPFGVVLIREGVEAGGPAVPYEVGTSAYVTQVEWLKDERMNIEGLGYQRFKIRELRFDRPYLVGLVEDYPLQGTDRPEAVALAAEVSATMRAYLQSLMEAADVHLSLDEIPNEGPGLAFFVGTLLPLSLAEKQSILAAESLLKMFEQEKVLIKRETALLGQIAAQERRRRNTSSPFSNN
jgi:Lon protease-like protein